MIAERLASVHWRLYLLSVLHNPPKTPSPTQGQLQSRWFKITGSGVTNQRIPQKLSGVKSSLLLLFVLMPLGLTVLAAGEKRTTWFHSSMLTTREL